MRAAQAEAIPFSQGSPLASATLVRRQENRAKRVRLYEEMLSLHQQGKSQRRIARELGVSRGRVVTYLREGVPDGARVRRGSILDPYLPHLHRRWLEGCRGAVSLCRELKARGYRAVAAWSSATAKTCVSAWPP